MFAQLAPSPSPSPANLSHLVYRRSCRKSTYAVSASLPTANSSRPPIQIVGRKDLNLDFTRKDDSIGFTLEPNEEEIDWMNLESDIRQWTRALRPVQWYPGHIMKTEKELREQLKLMDVVIEVRDARIPLSTTHPKGTMELGRLAKSLAGDVIGKRREKGLLPRPVRAGIIGYPNVGKSSLINRLFCAAAPRPGVTREMKWVKLGKDLDLLDSPGMLPMRIDDQAAAIKLAICDDIGEKAYDFTDVAGILVKMLAAVKSNETSLSEISFLLATIVHGFLLILCSIFCRFVKTLGLNLFSGDNHQATFRILTDFRKGKFGYISLERSPLR